MLLHACRRLSQHLQLEVHRKCIRDRLQPVQHFHIVAECRGEQGVASVVG
jgi:hypothetical protein